MKRNFLIVFSLCVGLLAGGALPLLAHHAISAEFDTTKDVLITGTLTKLENVNPHSWWYIDVKTPDDKVTPWKLESNSPSGLIRLGLKVKSEVKVGDVMTFRVAPAWKDPAGMKLAWMKSVTVNGKEFVLTEL